MFLVSSEGVAGFSMGVGGGHHTVLLEARDQWEGRSTLLNRETTTSLE